MVEINQKDSLDGSKMVDLSYPFQLKVASNYSENIKKIVPKTKPGYGNCSKCSWPGFVGGSGVYSCQRPGCGHHYNDHW